MLLSPVESRLNKVSLNTLSVKKAKEETTNIFEVQANDIDTQSIIPVEPVISGKKNVPKEIDKQVDAVYKLGMYVLDNDIPAILKPFTKGIKRDAAELLEKKELKEQISIIFEKARLKPENADKDIIQLLKDDDAFEEIYDALKTNSKEYKTVNFILKQDFTKKNGKKICRK